MEYSVKNSQELLKENKEEGIALWNIKTFYNPVIIKTKYIDARMEKLAIGTE